MLEDRPGNSALRCQLRPYLEQGLGSLGFLLRAEAAPGSAAQRCFQVLDPKLALADALKDKVAGWASWRLNSPGRW